MEGRRATEEPKICVGERVVWLGSDTGKPEHGTVCWTGVLETLNHSECSVGVELDHPVGFGDGKWGDMELFKAKPRHGIIIPAMGLVREDDFHKPHFTSLPTRARDPPLNVGDRVVWLELASPQHATVRWVGVLSELGSDWTIGIEFDKPEGKMDGMWNNSRLFDCKKGHGMLVNAMGLIREDVFMGCDDDPSITILPVDENGHGDTEGENGHSDRKIDEPTCESGGASAIPSGSSTVVRAPTLAECEVQKWYDALEEDRRHKTRLKKDKKRKRFSFRRRPNGQEDDNGLPGAGYSDQIDGDNDDSDSYVTEVFDVGKSPTATLPRKKTKRGGLFALFRWIRGKTRKRSGNVGGRNASVMRRSLSLDAAEGAHCRAVSVTSVSESFQYMPHGVNLRVPSEGMAGDDGSLYESMTTPMASPLCGKRQFGAAVQPSDSSEALPEEEEDESKTQLSDIADAEKPKVILVVVVTPEETPVVTPVITPAVTPVPSHSGAKKRRAPPPPSTPPVVTSVSAPNTVIQPRSKSGHHRSVSLVVGSSSGSAAAAHLHVKGKRKAPPPPCQVAPSPREVVRELRRSNPVLPACESKPYRSVNVGRQMCKSVSSEVLHPMRDIARSFSSRSLGMADDGSRKDLVLRKDLEVPTIVQETTVKPVASDASVTVAVADTDDPPISKESLADILKALDNLHTDLEEQTTKKQPETVDLRTLHDMVQSLVKQFCGKGDEDPSACSPKPVTPKVTHRTPNSPKVTHGSPVNPKVTPGMAVTPAVIHEAPVHSSQAAYVKRRSASLGAEPDLAPPRLPEKRKPIQRPKHRSVQDWIRIQAGNDKPPKTPKTISGDDEINENDENIYEAISFGPATPTEANYASVAELRRLYGGGSDRRIPQPGPIYENVHPYSFAAGIAQAPPHLFVAPPPSPRYPLYAPVPKRGYFYPDMMGLGIQGFVYPPHLVFQPGIAQENWGGAEEADYENGGFVGGAGAGAGRKSFVASQVKRIEAANRWSSNIGTASGVVVHSQNAESNRKLDCDEWSSGDEEAPDEEQDEDDSDSDRQGKRSSIQQAARRREVNAHSGSSRPVPAPRSSIQPHSGLPSRSLPLPPRASRPLPRPRGSEGDSSVMIGGYRVATPLDLWPLEYEAIAPELSRLQAKLSGKVQTEDLADETTLGEKDSLSINRLLRKLEAAICRGHRKEAGALARELAHLKINCSVKRLRLAKDTNPRDMPIILNLYVEDRVSHHGPIPIQAFPRMTVGELKSKMFQDFEFPPNVQRWILGRSLITDDDVTLDSKGVDRDGCPIYLYLVSLDECMVVPSSDVRKSGRSFVESHTYENVAAAAAGNSDSDVGACAGAAKNGIEEELGWRCERCTLINTPTRPGCEACSSARPDDYVVPQKYRGLQDEEEVIAPDFQVVGGIYDVYQEPGESADEELELLPN